jgi:hypothetical protein
VEEVLPLIDVLLVGHEEALKLWGTTAERSCEGLQKKARARWCSSEGRRGAWSCSEAWPTNSPLFL